MAGRGPASFSVTRSWATGFGRGLHPVCEIGARRGRHAAGPRSMTGIRGGREGALLSKLLSDNIAFVKMSARKGVVLGGISSCGRDERCA